MVQGMNEVLGTVLTIAPFASGMLLIDRFGRKTVLHIGQALLIFMLIFIAIFKLVHIDYAVLAGIFICKFIFLNKFYEKKKIFRLFFIWYCFRSSTLVINA